MLLMMIVHVQNPDTTTLIQSFLRACVRVYTHTLVMIDYFVVCDDTNNNRQININGRGCFFFFLVSVNKKIDIDLERGSGGMMPFLWMM